MSRRGSAALAEREAALIDAQAQFAQLQASSSAALVRMEQRFKEQAEQRQQEHSRQLAEAEKRLGEAHSEREAEMADAQV